jgi:hypothetical protein
VELRSLGGTLLMTVARFSNVDATATGDYVERGPFDLTGFAGQSVQLVFKALTDDALTTAFRIDDASLTAQVPKGDRGSLPPATAVTAPTDGTTVSGTVTVMAQSTAGAPNETVTRTEVSVDGALLGGASAPSVSVPWDTMTAPNGAHTLVSKAFGSTGKVWTGSPITVTVANPPEQQVLSNPGFESGDAGWTATPGVVTDGSDRGPHSGTGYAWLDGYGQVHQDRLSQATAIPAGAGTAELSFWLHIDSAQTGTEVVDTLRVEILGPTDILLSRLITYTNLGAADGFGLKTFDLSGFAGQSIQVAFTGTEDQARQTSFVVDDVSLRIG